MRISGYIYLLFLITILASCDPGIQSYEDYVEWINNEDNGILKTKKIGGLTFAAKYLPTDYLLYQDVGSEEGIEQNEIDSLKKVYQNSITIQLSFYPSEEEAPGDLMYADITTYAEYKEKVLNISFDIKEQISLKTGSLEYNPVLTLFENTYGLKPGRDIVCVFVPDKKEAKDFYNSEKLDFVFTDNIFQSGINHFVFDRKSVNKSEEIEFISKIFKDHDK